MIKRLFFLAIIVLVGSVLNQATSQQNNSHQDKRDTTSKPPTFKDKGRTVENLKAAYKCESIEFENWEDDDAVDAQLTVCLINSKNVPAGDESYTQLKAIAKQIKSTVSHPEKYKSYYIIFVKRETQFGITFGSHTAGANIPSKEL
jgi:hypothetical protein